MSSSVAMAGLVPAIHVFFAAGLKTWMPGRAGHDERWCLRRVHQHQFGILQRGDRQLGLVSDRGAVAGIDPDAVDLDAPAAGTR